MVTGAHLLRHVFHMHCQVHVHCSYNRHPAASCSCTCCGASCTATQAPLCIASCLWQLWGLEQVQTSAAGSCRAKHPEVLETDALGAWLLVGKEGDAKARLGN